MVFLSYIFFVLMSSSSGYQIQNDSLTVSGISSGAHMATQLQIVHSSRFQGAALLAGGLFNCSGGNVSKALTACMKENKNTPETGELLEAAQKLEQEGGIDPLRNVSGQRVFLVSGKLDSVVAPEIMARVKALMLAMNVAVHNIKYVDFLEMGHAFPTEGYGNDCEAKSKAPYISKCEYDGAGELLKHLYSGNLLPKQQALEENLFDLPQAYEDLEDPATISMDTHAKVYVPGKCQQGGACKLHVALHGCSQSVSNIQDQFYRHTGYNEWAEANAIIVLYPQTRPTRKNFMACWDWMGYTGKDFATRSAPQILAIMNMVHRLSQPDFSF